MKTFTAIFFISFYFISGKTYAQDYSIKLHADFIYLDKEHKPTLDIYYKLPADAKGSLSVNCFKYKSDKDSIKVFSKTQSKYTFQEGIHTNSLLITGEQSSIDPQFYNILKTAIVTPAGSYKMYIDLQTDSFTVHRIIVREVDSNLEVNAPIRKDIDQSLLPKSKNNLLKAIFSKATQNLIPTGSITALVDKSQKKIEQSIRSKGLTPVITHSGNKTLINLYYEDWFVGRYEIDNQQTLTSQIENRRKQAGNGIGSSATNDLADYQSIFSQFKKLKKDKKDNQEVIGEIAVTSNFSNGQPEYSQQDNNYYEVRGRVELPVMGIPVGIEGYYTTQDNNRPIKASYIRAHYDVDKAKEELMKMIDGYKQKYNQTVSKGQGLQQIYGSYLNNLESQRSQMLSNLTRQTGIPSLGNNPINPDNLKQQIESNLQNTMKDTAALRQQAISGMDSNKTLNTTATAKRIQDSANYIYTEAMKEYTRLMELEQKIQKYKTLLEQYKNTSFFDSSLAYDKLKDLKNTDQMTYKQIAKKAGNLLPEGKAKTFIAGLTNLDVGMFPKYASKYTLSGQQIKGIDLGYDLGICETGFTVGKTEYIDRTGNIDKYTSYSARATFHPFKDQKMRLVYYGYTPSKQMLAEDHFFKNLDIATPTFKNPVHIVSGIYEATLFHNIRVSAEAAGSFKRKPPNNGQDSLTIATDTTNTSVPLKDKIAYNINAEGDIPHTNISLLGSYEKAGKNFENASLPISVQGTERYKVAAKSTFFKNFLSIGLEYNYMQQNSFASSGGNSRWGFDIKTHSKRYPSIAFSYKPFTTFRSFTDTFRIPQRPLLGAVWTGRASYQFKKKGRSYRFMFVYNKSTSQMDTLLYKSDLLQFTFLYTYQKLTASVNIGNTQLTSTGAPTTSTANPIQTPNTKFVSVTANYTLTKQIIVNGGQDIGFASFGLSRNSTIAGFSYRFKKFPITTRFNFRYNSYLLSQQDSWKKLYGGTIDVIWSFKYKMGNG